MFSHRTVKERELSRTATKQLSCTVLELELGLAGHKHGLGPQYPGLATVEIVGFRGQTAPTIKFEIQTAPTIIYI